MTLSRWELRRIEKGKRGPLLVAAYLTPGTMMLFNGWYQLGPGEFESTVKVGRFVTGRVRLTLHPPDGRGRPQWTWRLVRGSWAPSPMDRVSFW